MSDIETRGIDSSTPHLPPETLAAAERVVRSFPGQAGDEAAVTVVLQALGIVATEPGRPPVGRSGPKVWLPGTYAWRRTQLGRVLHAVNDAGRARCKKRAVHGWRDPVPGSGLGRCVQCTRYVDPEAVR